MVCNCWHKFLAVKIKVMEKDNKFPEQQAPTKNTDNAFIQVGEDGSPVVPNTDEKETDIEKDSSPTSLNDR